MIVQKILHKVYRLPQRSVSNLTSLVAFGRTRLLLRFSDNAQRAVRACKETAVGKMGDFRWERWELHHATISQTKPNRSQEIIMRTKCLHRHLYLYRKLVTVTVKNQSIKNPKNFQRNCKRWKDLTFQSNLPIWCQRTILDHIRYL
jgi:hypothetical protein